MRLVFRIGVGGRLYGNHFLGRFGKAAVDHVYTQNNERNAQYLSHVEHHSLFEIHLLYLDELDYEACEEYALETHAEENSWPAPAAPAMSSTISPLLIHWAVKVVSS